MNYDDKKKAVNKAVKEGKWNNPMDGSKDAKVCRVTTEDCDYPYSYDDSNHSTDYEKSKAPDTTRER